MIKDIPALCVLVKMHVICPMSSQQIVQFLDQSADGRDELDKTFRNQHDTEVIALRCTMSHDIGNILDDIVQSLVLGLNLL